MFSSNRLKYFIIALAICLIAVKAASLLTYHAIKPAPSNNLKAYLLLNQGAASDDSAHLQACADQAVLLASDEDLKKAARMFSRVAALNLRAGNTQFSDADSLSGSIKLLLTAATKPSFDDMAFLLEGLLTDPEKLVRQLENRYQPILRKEHEALKWSKVVFWYGLAFGLYVVWQRRPAAISVTTEAPESKAQSDLITCPACGSRNRNQTLTTGQKLVCGQCKAVLLTVS